MADSENIDLKFQKDPSHSVASFNTTRLFSCGICFDVKIIILQNLKVNYFRCLQKFIDIQLPCIVVIHFV